MNNVERVVVTMYEFTEFIKEITELVSEIADSCDDKNSYLKSR